MCMFTCSRYKRLLSYVVLIFSSFLSLNTIAQLSIPNWTGIKGHLKTSNYYTVSVKQGNSGFKTVKTLMTHSQNELITTNENKIFHNRTFNFAPFSFDPQGGTVTIKVTKKNLNGNVATNAGNVEVIGAASKKYINANTVEFTLTHPKYVSVNFKLNSNKNTSGVHSVVKHMLMIFADPKNNDLVEPNGNGKLVYNPQLTEKQIRDADILVFRKGYHDIKKHFGIRGIRVTTGTKVWLAQDAIVSGFIVGVDENGKDFKPNMGIQSPTDITIYGRGLLYMGEYRNNVNNPSSGPYWRPGDNPHNSDKLPDGINLPNSKNVVVRGIIMGDIMFHGLVTGNFSTIDRVKLWGWHPNNDGFRPGFGSTVKNNFLRTVDDALYAFDILVENNVFWPSYNGAVLTAGWVGKYNTGGIALKNSTVLYPEWFYLGNNNGVVMSQLGDKQECTDITVSNMKIYGDTIALLNLKPSSRREQSVDFDQAVNNAGIKQLLMENVTVFGNLKGPNLLQSDNKWSAKNIKLKNVKITGFANRNLTNNDRSNNKLFKGNNLTNNNYLSIETNTSTTTNTTNTNTNSQNIANGKYYIKNKLSGKFIEVGAFSTKLGANIQQWPNAVGTNKQWQINHTSNNLFILKNVNSQQVMDVALFSKNNGGNIQQWNNSGKDNQKFEIFKDGSYFKIKSKDSGKCVEVAGITIAEKQKQGANIQQWTCNSNDSQKFQFIKVN